MNQNNDVLFDELPAKEGQIGLITLNRPAVLNALNTSMITMMHEQLTHWANAPTIKAVIILAAEGRAFCAGGDLRSTYDWHFLHGTPSTHFFQNEYRLNRLIFHFPKPYIALLDGITMGGGAGIAIPGSHRLATERLIFAMPETGIGFFPDVGGSYFLPRLPNQMGFYLGLTGAQLNADEAVFLKLAQHKIHRDQLSHFIEALTNTSWGENPHQTVTTIIQGFQTTADPAHLTLLKHADLIQSCFSHDTIEAIFQALYASSDPFCDETLKILNKKSPTSLKITLRALQLGQKLDFDACMQMEYRLANRFLQAHDFLEGIRAVIIDKDQSPRWNPAHIEAILSSDVEKYFSPLDHELV